MRFNDKEPEGNGKVGNEMQGPSITSRNGEEANPEDDAKKALKISPMMTLRLPRMTLREILRQTHGSREVLRICGTTAPRASFRADRIVAVAAPDLA